jgi:hypothetical protein
MSLVNNANPGTEKLHRNAAEYYRGRWLNEGQKEWITLYFNKNTINNLTVICIISDVISKYLHYQWCNFKVSAEHSVQITRG